MKHRYVCYAAPLLLLAGQAIAQKQIDLKDFYTPKGKGQMQQLPGCNPSVYNAATCRASILNQPDIIYNKNTRLISSEAFDQHVLKNFQYTVAGKDKVANSASLELASPKFKLSGVHKLKANASFLLKYELSGGLNDDNRIAPVFNSDKFNTEFGLKCGVVLVCGNNASVFNIKSALKKPFHLYLISITNDYYKRADTLVKLRRWMAFQSDATILDEQEQSDMIYDFFTSNLTDQSATLGLTDPLAVAMYRGMADPADGFEDYKRAYNNASARLAHIKMKDYQAYLAHFADMDDQDKAMQLSSDPVKYGFVENKVAELQDSLSKPYWTWDKLNWIGLDIGFKNALLNNLPSFEAESGTNANPYYDLQAGINVNRLITDVVNKSRFYYFKLSGGGGRGNNSRYLTTKKIDKDLYYVGDIIQLNYAFAGLECYGNPFRSSGLPGYNFVARAEYSVEYRNPWVLSLEGGLLFNLLNKDDDNFLFIMPTVGFTDVAEPGIDVKDNFFWNVKFGIPINIRYK